LVTGLPDFQKYKSGFFHRRFLYRLPASLTTEK
jgi:hypothetical protein